MCGRFAYFAARQKLREMLALDNEIELPPRYNIAPMQEVPIVVRDRIGMARWGFADRYINARQETVAEKPAFREAWAQRRRCLIPASGWYEWRGGRQPYFIRGREDVLLFGGIWERSTTGVRFAVLTQDAHGALAELHPRRPVVVPAAEADRWFGGEDIPAAPDDLTFHPVSPEIGQVANDDASLVEAWAADKATFRLVS